jgi:hypothetical protein
LRPRERLTDERFDRLWEEIFAQEATGKLLLAWIAKEEQRSVLLLASQHALRSEISRTGLSASKTGASAPTPPRSRFARPIDAW